MSSKKRIFDVEKLVKSSVTFSDNFAILDSDCDWENNHELLVLLENMRMKGYIPCSKLGDTKYVIFYKSHFR